MSQNAAVNYTPGYLTTAQDMMDNPGQWQATDLAGHHDFRHCRFGMTMV